MTRAILGVAAAALVTSTGMLAQGEGPSRTAARDLTQQLDARHLDAVAAADPTTPGRFIAALYIAPSQLLVVGAAHPAGDALLHRISQQQYRDVYLDLQASPATRGKWFVHDLGADGLGAAKGTSIDNVYESGTPVALSDTRSKHGDTFARSDAEYTRMLRILLASLQQPEPGSATERHTTPSSN